MDNRLEEKWDMLDEKEQRMIVSYMNNFINSSDRSAQDRTLLNLDDSPSRRRHPVSMAQNAAPARIIGTEERIEREREVEQVSESGHAPVVKAEEHKEANPAALGLLGFGFTTLLLNLHNAGVIELSVLILSMGIFLGGLAQVIAGIVEFKNHNTFGATAFTSYGLFWWSLVVILVNPDPLGGIGASHTALGFYMLIWCVYTFFLYIGTLKMARAQQVVFASLTILFFLLAFENFTGIAIVGLLAGIVGIFCGAAAVYTALGVVLNDVYGRSVIPLG